MSIPTKRHVGWLLIVSSIVLAVLGFLMIDWSEWDTITESCSSRKRYLPFWVFVFKEGKIFHKEEKTKHVDVPLPPKCVDIEIHRIGNLRLPYFYFRSSDHECKERVESAVFPEVPGLFTTYDWKLFFYHTDSETATIEIIYWREGIHYKNWLIFCVILAYIGSILVITYKSKVKQ